MFYTFSMIKENKNLNKKGIEKMKNYTGIEKRDITEKGKIKRALFELNMYHNVMQYKNESDFYIDKALNKPKIEKCLYNVYVIK